MFHEQPLSRSDKLYVFLAAMFTAILVLTNIIGTKLFIVLGETLPKGFFGSSLILTTGIITYPLTFWFTDIVSEIWGKKRADLMVFIGFFASLVMLGVLVIAKAVPPAPIWNMGPEYAQYFHPDLLLKDAAGNVTGVKAAASQAAYSFTFDAPGILLFASMLAYLCAQLTDNYMYHFWRRITKGRHLWLRNNGSTAVSQLVDTIIVNGIFLHFYWKLPFAVIAQITITVYLCKLLMALIDTPLIYLGVYTIRRSFGRQGIADAQ